jgi:hypothetical protein
VNTKRAISALWVCLLTSSAAYCQSVMQAKGALPLSREEYLRIHIARSPVSGPLPSSATLEDLFPRAQEQGDRLSCTAFACIYNKTYRIYLASGRIGIPEDYLQSPSFVYSALTHGKCAQGLYIPRTLAFLKIVGSVSWKSLIYDTSHCPNWNSYKTLAKNNSFAAERLRLAPEDALKDIRNHIVYGDPVIAEIDACKELESPLNGLIPSTLGPQSSCGPHTIVIVGFDDRLAGGAVRILNSWGTKWGDNGKAWMSYAVLKKRLREAYVDYGPEEATREEIDSLSDIDEILPNPGIPPISSSVLLTSLRTNISPKVLARFPPINGEQVNISIWSIWLALSPENASQIDDVGYYFEDPTFKHNPQQSQLGSSIFLAQWRGYGCVDKAHLIAHLKNGRAIRADFDFCKLTETSLLPSLP